MMRLMSRTPDNDICMVRGMGVADNSEHVDGLAQVLHLLLMAHARALLLVDDDQPEIARVDVARQSRCVPTSTDTVPSANPFRAFACWTGVRKQESTSTVTPKGSKRSLKLT